MKKKNGRKRQSILKYEPVGLCGECHMAIEAQQPGGKNPRHILDQTEICNSRSIHESKVEYNGIPITGPIDRPSRSTGDY